MSWTWWMTVSVSSCEGESFGGLRVSSVFVTYSAISADEHI